MRAPPRARQRRCARAGVRPCCADAAYDRTGAEPAWPSPGREHVAAGGAGVTQIDRVVRAAEETLKGHSVQLLAKKALPSLDLPKARGRAGASESAHASRRALLLGVPPARGGSARARARNACLRRAASGFTLSG